MPRAPDKEIERNLSKLAADAESLADGLDQHANEIQFCGIELIVDNYRARPSTLYDGKIGPYYDSILGPASVQALLRQFAKRLKARHAASLPLLRPTKRRAKEAERTYLVRAVAHFLLTHGGEPHWDWVARSVTAMTNTGTLDAGHAQKLFVDLKGVSQHPAED